MARLKDRSANVGLRAALLEHAIEIRDALCGPPTMPIDGRPPAEKSPELDGALWQAFGAPVDQLAAGKEVLIHSYELPDWHVARQEGNLWDTLSWAPTTRCTWPDADGRRGPLVRA
jgi:hypothetical protein